mgnify:CR=1 FL=1
MFGKTFTDHMFLMNYDAGQGWHDPRVVPYLGSGWKEVKMVYQKLTRLLAPRIGLYFGGMRKASIFSKKMIY